MAEQAPDITAAQDDDFLVGQRFLNWRNMQETQEVLQWIRHSVGSAQDDWANGAFSTWEANLLAQGGAKALGELVDRLEKIKLYEDTPTGETNDE